MLGVEGGPLDRQKMRRAANWRREFAQFAARRCLRCFLGLSDLGPTCFLSQRNSPAPGSGEHTLGAVWRRCVDGCTGAPGKPFENGNSFPKLLDLILCVPAFLAEPVNCLCNVCH